MGETRLRRRLSKIFQRLMIGRRFRSTPRRNGTTSRSPREAMAYLRNRFNPSEENRQERADMVRTQLWLQDQSWVTLPHGRRLLTRLTRPVPRMDTLYVVRAALDGYARTST